MLAIVNDEDVVFEGKALGVGLDSDITLRNFQIPMDALHIELDEHNYHVKKSPLDELLIPQSAYRIYLGYEIDDIFILEDESQE
ncbi:hypothetical protein NK662_18250 [Ectobacillus sp. SYSU M60031]|uniref:Uncharacterized protein n=1 Tax=Ectobacillus ponti TaxID=2961894 RepID=A0AA41XCP9_9BACI|nr:hypothetical protein [Ectobacillus ponti]